MKKFFFRLEKLLTLRKAKEQIIKRELEHAHQKCIQIQEKEQMLQSQISLLIEEMHKKRLEGKLRLQETYCQILEHLNKALVQVQYNLQAQQGQLQEQKARFKHAIQERKIIEKIKENQYAGWRTRESLSEGALLDEIALKKSIDTK